MLGLKVEDITDDIVKQLEVDIKNNVYPKWFSTELGGGLCFTSYYNELDLVTTIDSAGVEDEEGLHIPVIGDVEVVEIKRRTEHERDNRVIVRETKTVRIPRDAAVILVQRIDDLVFADLHLGYSYYSKFNTIKYSREMEEISDNFVITKELRGITYREFGEEQVKIVSTKDGELLIVTDVWYRQKFYKLTAPPRFVAHITRRFKNITTKETTIQITDRVKNEKVVIEEGEGGRVWVAENGLKRPVKAHIKDIENELHDLKKRGVNPIEWVRKVLC